MIAWFIIGILGIIALTVVLALVSNGLQIFLNVIQRPCPSCATQISPAAKVCPHCQQPVPPPPSAG